MYCVGDGSRLRRRAFSLPRRVAASRGGKGGLGGAEPLTGPLCNPPGTPRFSAASSGLLACRATALFLFGFSLSAIRRRCAADAPGANPVCDRGDLPPRSAKPLPFLLRMKIERCWLSLRNKMKFHIF